MRPLISARSSVEKTARRRPTATISSIAGCYECIEPQVSNLFKRETLSGEFMQINRYLVRELQARNLWDEQMINDIKAALRVRIEKLDWMSASTKQSALKKLEEALA